MHRITEKSGDSVINSSNSSFPEFILDDDIGTVIGYETGSQIFINPVCRVWFEEMSEQDVKRYCRCRGSVGYIHDTCLMKWIQMRGEPNPVWELCGAKFNYIVKNSTGCSCKKAFNSPARSGLIIMGPIGIVILTIICMLVLSGN